MKEELRQDMEFLVREAGMIDEMFENEHHERYHRIKKFRRSLDRFNRKYSGIKAALAKQGYKMHVKILINGESVRSVLDSTDILVNEVNPSKDGQITSALMLRMDTLHNKIEVLYRDTAFKNSDTPEMQLLNMNAKLNSPMDIRVLR